MDSWQKNIVKNYLLPDERAERFCDVLYQTDSSGRTWNGLLALTDQRLIFENDARDFVATRAYSDIRALSLEKTFFGGRIKIEFENPDAVVYVKPLDRRDRSRSLMEDIRLKLA